MRKLSPITGSTHLSQVGYAQRQGGDVSRETSDWGSLHPKPRNTPIMKTVSAVILIGIAIPSMLRAQPAGGPAPMPPLPPPGKNTPGANPPGMNPPATNIPGTNNPGMNPPGTNTPGTNSPRMNTPGTNSPGATNSLPLAEPINGVGNNVINTNWGSAGTDLIRLAPVAYADGISTPGLPGDLSARAISNLVNNQAESTNAAEDIQTVDRNNLSGFGYSFGQFMDHDMDLTLDNGASLPIAVATNDPIGVGDGTPLAFNRSIPDPSTGTSFTNPAQDVNTITSYFDLSQIYGSDTATDQAIRSFTGGQLKTSPGGLPPLDNATYFTTNQLTAINASVGGMANDGPLPDTSLFVTGDSRGNENVELTALQVLFLENHNRIAGILQASNPTWSDEQIFQTARKLNIASYQSIIYNEWIPSVLGPQALRPYTGYKPWVSATIANEFSTVAFRFGHSILSGSVGRDDNNGLPLAEDVPLAVDFFDSTILNGEGQPQQTDSVTGLTTTSIDAVLKGDADINAQAMDVMVINEVRNLLFNEVVPGVGGGQDLVALDIQRGRDHGIPNYNALRVAVGLPQISSFKQITRNVSVQQSLARAYPGGVNTMDAFEGGLAEDPLPGSDVGPLFWTILVNQFTRLRDGDRFFYLNESFTPQEQQILQNGNSLAKVIRANTQITNLQANVMIWAASISGTISSQGKGSPKVKVNLEDTNSDILASTITDPNGNYHFDQQSGPAVNPALNPGISKSGFYRVVPEAPAGMEVSPAAPPPILISRGDIHVNGANYSLVPSH